jgi:hypothetical protein
MVVITPISAKEQKSMKALFATAFLRDLPALGGPALDIAGGRGITPAADA